jgi:5'-3' exonuclease
MPVQKIIQESLNRNPLEMKEALVEELRARVAAALESKINESKDEDDEDEDDDEDDEDEEEELDEVSGAKLGSYMVKARKSEADADKMIDKSFDEPENDNKAYRKPLSRTMNARRLGQRLAMSKLRGDAKVNPKE